MTAPATSAVPAAAPAKKPAKQTIRDVIAADYRGGMPLTKALFVAARKRGLGPADSEDAAQETFRIAMEHEDDGMPWDPPDDVEAHLLRIQDNLLAERRRKYRKKPTDSLGQDKEIASLGATPEAMAIEEHDRARFAAEIRKQLAAETRSGLTVRILDLLQAGMHGHETLARELACKVTDIRNAFKRIERRRSKVYAAAGLEEDP
jgi:DNA-directed RNA polymerase specialized sigma24 family protein